MEHIMKECEIKMTPSEVGVEIVTRGNETQKVVMYINHNAHEVKQGEITLAPFECKIVSL